MKKISVRNYYKVVRVYFNFLYNEKYIAQNPIINIKTPKVTKNIISFFKEKDIDIIFTAYDKNTFLGYRNYTLKVIFFSTGVRKNELLNLQCSNIFFENDIISIIGKGDKERIIPLSPVYCRILITYMKKEKNISGHTQILIQVFFL